VIFLANEMTKEKEMELASRKQYDKLIRKEEELLLASLDLKKELEGSHLLREEEKAKFNKELRQYIHVMEELPFSVLTINNLGMVLFFNRHAEKQWKKKQKEVIGSPVKLLFPNLDSSEIISTFVDPAKSKNAGIHEGQVLEIPGRSPEKRTLMLIRTDLKEEVLYSLIIL
jgi:nitrogen fixation/metabolism regulation signal transduction histidine kinase